MRVDRHRDFEVAVTDDLPNHVGRDTQVEQQGDARVSHVMKSGAGELSRGADAAPAPAQVIWLHRSADAGGEDEPVFLPVGPGVGPLAELLTAVLPERTDAERRKRDGARRIISLGPDETQRPADPLQRPRYLECARVEVDVLPAQTE